MHHYTVVKRNAPDLNLDGKVNATDATTLANNMGTSLHEHGHGDGGPVRRVLSGRQLGKGRPRRQRLRQPGRCRLAGRAVHGARRQPARSPGVSAGRSKTSRTPWGSPGRWKAGRNAQNNLVETGNFTQDGTNFLSWSGTGVGASKRSNSFVTIRNQNSAETTAGVNSQSRTMQADLSDEHRPRPEPGYVCHVSRPGKHDAAVGVATGVEQSHAVARFSE